MQGQRRYKLLWTEIANAYAKITTQIGKHGEAAPEKWLQFSVDLQELMMWADLMAAAYLRWRALRKLTRFLSDENATAAKVIEANDWAWPQMNATNALIQQRALWTAQVEHFYLAKKARTINALMKGGQDYIPMFRLDRIKRDAIGEITNVSEQIQLAIPEIGDAFPFAVYHTREDARVRSTHAAMNRFAAVRSWQYWPVCRPRNGYSCRCWLKLVERTEARERGWLNAHGEAKFETRWPNTAAQMNFEAGRFPDVGWHGPKFWAWPTRPIARVA